MLILKIISEDSKQIVFHYYPEGKTKYGVVVIDKEEQDVSSYEIAKNDEFRSYLGHAISNALRYLTDRHFKNQTTIAWY